MKFSCPLCAQHLEASSEMSGEMIECPSCNKSIKIPTPYDPSANDDEIDCWELEKTKSKIGKKLVWVISLISFGLYGAIRQFFFIGSPMPAVPALLILASSYFVSKWVVSSEFAKVQKIVASIFACLFIAFFALIVSLILANLFPIEPLSKPPGTVSLTATTLLPRPS